MSEQTETAYRDSAERHRPSTFEGLAAAAYQLRQQGSKALDISVALRIPLPEVMRLLESGEAAA